MRFFKVSGDTESDQMCSLQVELEAVYPQGSNFKVLLFGGNSLDTWIKPAIFRYERR